MSFTINGFVNHYASQFKFDTFKVEAPEVVGILAPEDSIDLSSNNAVFGAKGVQLLAAKTISCKERTFIAGKALQFRAQEVTLEGQPDAPVIFIAPEKISIQSAAIKIQNAAIYCLPGFTCSLQADKVEIDNVRFLQMKSGEFSIEEEEIATCHDMEGIKQVMHRLKYAEFLERYELEREVSKQMNLRSILV